MSLRSALREPAPCARKENNQIPAIRSKSQEWHWRNHMSLTTTCNGPPQWATKEEDNVRVHAQEGSLHQFPPRKMPGDACCKPVLQAELGGMREQKNKKRFKCASTRHKAICHSPGSRGTPTAHILLLNALTNL